jgi:hypothetical protein
MSVYCVCYTLGETGTHSLDGPREKLRNLGEVCEITPSTWLLDTTLHTRAIMNRLETDLGNNDQLAVFEVANQGDWSFVQGPKVTQEGTAVWMQRHVGMA